MNRLSLRARLAVGLGFTAIIGAVLLLGLVAAEYVIGADQPLDSGDLWHEVGDHVVAPLAVMLCASAAAGWFAISAALAPLLRAAADMERTAVAAPRGVRIDPAVLPQEAGPFADAINRLLARLDAAAAAQEAFAADVAHELKTPLAVLALELEALPGGERLRADVAALSRLIDQLLALARLELQGGPAAAPERVDLAALAEQTVALLAPAAVRAGRELAFDDAGAETVGGRAEAIAAALRNLVDNALRATPPGGLVTVRAGPGRMLGVADGGPGLSPERLETLSRRAARAEHASPDGAGLGLAIVARIMAAHGGSVQTDGPDRSVLRLVFPA
jgi:two-component system, OmpR family, sensor kinase